VLPVSGGLTLKLGLEDGDGDGVTTAAVSGGGVYGATPVNDDPR
jgi:hypothetical protein